MVLPSELVSHSACSLTCVAVCVCMFVASFFVGWLLAWWVGWVGWVGWWGGLVGLVGGGFGCSIPCTALQELLATMTPAAGQDQVHMGLSNGSCAYHKNGCRNYVPFRNDPTHFELGQ